MSDRFDDAEYAARGDRVRAAMAVAEIDVLYVTSPPNILYLTGYEAVWYPWRLPLGCAIVRDPELVLFFDWDRHAAYADLHARRDHLVLFAYGEAPEVVARAFADHGLAGATVGLERSSLTPVGPVIDAVAAALTAGGATVADGDWIVDDIRLYKSPAELERLRRAGAIADDAFAELQQRLRAGMTEIEVAALLGLLLAERGSEAAASPSLVSSGPTGWMDTHSFPSRRVLEDGDTVCVDSCAVIDRYHANLCRTFAIGTPDPRAQALLEAGAGSIGELQRLARIGDGPEQAAAAAQRWIGERVPPDKVWWIGGYSLGIGLPPSWVGHTYLANDGLRPVILQAGYVSNYEMILFDREAGFEAATIDTVLMTDAGLEVLSALPRTLLETGG
ncbi:MAG TPA: Xaa-Pro peptidase family protein [Baekduia sp.]|nr:Xaa-Pro peptidase family protein [Baekduia sp.]